MGGRGAYLRSGGIGILPEDREWKSVGTLEGVKLIVNLSRPNADQPPYSNTAGTMYYTLSGKSGKIKQISYYNKDHKIIRSVDIDFLKGNHHAHLWDSTGGRISHDPANERPLTNRDKHYLKIALEYNKSH